MYVGAREVYLLGECVIGGEKPRRRLSVLCVHRHYDPHQ